MRDLAWRGVEAVTSDETAFDETAFDETAFDETVFTEAAFVEADEAEEDEADEETVGVEETGAPGDAAPGSEEARRGLVALEDVAAILPAGSRRDAAVVGVAAVGVAASSKRT